MQKKPVPTSHPDEEKNDVMNEWFGELIDNVKTDHFLLSSNVASKDTADFWNSLIFGDTTVLISQQRETSSKYFISLIIKDYFDQLKEYDKRPLKLALGISNSKILVWSEIDDDDESTEDALLMSEAKVNAKYHQHGFYLCSTIIEKSDNLSVPSHYQSIID